MLVSFFRKLRKRNAAKVANAPNALAAQSPAPPTHDDASAVDATPELDFAALAAMVPRPHARDETSKAWAHIMRRSLRLLPSIDEAAILVINDAVEARLLKRRARRFEPLHLDCFDEDEEDDDDDESAEQERMDAAAIVIQRFVVRQHEIKVAALAAAARAAQEASAAVIIQRFFLSKRVDASVSASNELDSDESTDDSSSQCSSDLQSWGSSSIASPQTSRPASTRASSLQAHTRAFQTRIASVTPKVNSFNVPAPGKRLNSFKTEIEARRLALQAANRDSHRRILRTGAKVNSINHAPKPKPTDTTFQQNWAYFQAELSKRNSITSDRLASVSAKISSTRPAETTTPRAQAVAVPRSTPSLDDPAIAAANAKLRQRIRSAAPATDSHNNKPARLSTTPRAQAVAVPRSTPSLDDPAIAAANAKLRQRIRSAAPATDSHNNKPARLSTTPRARAAAVPRSTPSLDDPAIAAANAKLRQRIRSAKPATDSHNRAPSTKLNARAIKSTIDDLRTRVEAFRLQLTACQ